MPSLHDIAHGRTGLTAHDLDWVHLLLADWQLLADLSFADLVLWLPVRGAGGFVAAAQMRPTTGPTALHEDLVGTEAARGRRAELDRAFDERRICREGDPDWPGELPVREEAIPVVRAGRALAVVTRHTNLAAARTPSRLELTYLRAADDLAVMISEGRFPIATAAHQVALAPRVGDGLIRLDGSGVVTYASPNALSAYRRLGLATDLTGTRLGEVTAGLVPAQARAEPVDETLAATVGGEVAREADVAAGGATVRLRVIPLDPGGRHTGALVLCRDVTELRRREQELVSKDATIREIHHRVKNNLQTVAALLRLQARRLDAGDTTARDALAEAERRIGSIAVVHETLSRTADSGVDFDEVADRVAGTVGELSADLPTRVAREGRFGVLPPEVATPLALVVVELVQNAVEHGGPAGGQVTLDVRREAGRLRLRVIDSGVGVPAGFDPARDGGLGLQIVRTLVEGELDGALRVTPGATGGTVAQVDVPLPSG